MAPRAGKNAALTLGGTAITSYIDSMSVSFDTDTAETTTFGNTGKTYITTLTGMTVEVSGSWDPTSSTGPDALLSTIQAAGTAVSGTAYPGGTASGQVAYAASLLLTNYSPDSAVGDRVTFSASFLASGTATRSAL